MSGHNKWSKIKRTKGVADSKRGKIFTKLLREIQISVKMGGGDPKNNPRLRDAMYDARSHNMLKDTIERAIKKGTGELEGSNYEEVLYEGYGPGGVALLIACLTDNRNRTIADIRALMIRNGGTMGDSGSVAWMFEKKGILNIAKNAAPEEILTELTLNSGAEDLKDEHENWEVLTPPEQLASIRNYFETHGTTVASAGLNFIPKNLIEIQGETASDTLKLIELLEDLDDVQKVIANFDLSENELARLQNEPSP
jgi:YebC/PmpR family DNA-binding regulatory protein